MARSLRPIVGVLIAAALRRLGLRVALSPFLSLPLSSATACGGLALEHVQPQLLLLARRMQAVERVDLRAAAVCRAYVRARACAGPGISERARADSHMRARA